LRLNSTLFFVALHENAMEAKDQISGMSFYSYADVPWKNHKLQRTHKVENNAGVSAFCGN